MFFTESDTMQKVPCAVLDSGALPIVFWEQSTPLTVNSNLPSRAAWLRPMAFDEPLSTEPPSVEAELPAEDDDEEESSLPPPPPPVAMAMITMTAMSARRMKRFFL